MSFLAKIIILETRMNYLMKAHKLHCHMSHPCKNWRKLNLLLNHLPSSQIPPNPNFLIPFPTVWDFLPKGHKTDIPFRPIVSNTGIASYCLAKFLSTILSPFLLANIHTIKNSINFTKIIQNFPSSNLTMVSFL